RHVRLALDKAVKARPSIRVIAPMAGSDFERDAAGVTGALADGTEVRSALLGGTDGRKSFVRQRVGLRTHGWGYSATAIVATVLHEKDHGAVAHEFFLPGGPFAILPLRENEKGHRSNVVWAEKRAVAEALLALPKEDFLIELERRFGSFLGALDL